MMKTRKYLTVAMLAAAVVAWAGCNKSGSMDSSSSTNSASGYIPPSTNSDMIHDNPVNGMTNSASTNQMNP